MRAGREREPVEVLWATGKREIVEAQEIRAICGRGEIEQPAAAADFQFVSRRIEHGEHRAQARVDFRRGALEDHALALLRGELEEVCAGRDHAAVDHRIDREIRRGLAAIVRLRLRRFRQVADDERTRIRDAERARDASLVKAGRNLRRDFHREVLVHLRRGDSRMGKAKRSVVAEVCAGGIHVHIGTGACARWKNCVEPRGRQFRRHPCGEQHGDKRGRDERSEPHQWLNKNSFVFSTAQRMSS